MHVMPVMSVMPVMPVIPVCLYSCIILECLNAFIAPLFFRASFFLMPVIPVMPVITVMPVKHVMHVMPVRLNASMLIILY